MTADDPTGSASSTPPANAGPVCPACGSTNTKQVDAYEDAYGHLVLDYDCLDCKHEFSAKKGGI